MGLAHDLRAYCEGFDNCFRTRTRQAGENAYTYLRGQLTMEDARNFANLERRLTGGDGQSVQHFTPHLPVGAGVTDSPWESQAVYRQIQTEIKAKPALPAGGLLILDESPDEKAGPHSVGASRQHNGRLGKVDLCQVATCLT